MKRVVCLLVLFAVLTYIVPFVGCMLPAEAQIAAPDNIGNAQSGESAQNTASSQVPSAQSGSSDLGGQASAAVYDEAPLLILDEASGEVLSVPIKTFVMGAVAAEMPMTYPDEALKAQAVASHSYALAVKAQADGSNAALNGAYFSANPAQRRGYITDDMMRTMWGDKYGEYSTRLNAIVDEVIANVAVYNGEAALCCYHAISAGVTESSENVWGTYVPYLVSVSSAQDVQSEDYEVVTALSSQELYETLITSVDGIELAGQPTEWLGGVTNDAAGYVQSITIGNMTLTGTAFRTALSLRSAAFTIKFENHEFVITTHGYGHGVGMSQHGASAMAHNGAAWQEIIQHYFPGTSITTARELGA